MKKLIMVAAIAAVALAGCRSLTVENRGTDKGWKVTHWSHWLNSDIDGMSATIGTDGTVSFSLNGVKSSPSEEFNRSMQTYMGAAVQLGQIFAAAYNPSASTAAKTTTPAATTVNIVTPATTATTNATAAASADCPDCSDGACTPAAK